MRVSRKLVYHCSIKNCLMPSFKVDYISKLQHLELVYQTLDNVSTRAYMQSNICLRGMCSICCPKLSSKLKGLMNKYMK